MTKEAAQRRGAALKGRKRSAETKAKIGAAHRGKEVRAETRTRLSAAAKRRKATEAQLKGLEEGRKPPSTKTKHKMALSCIHRSLDETQVVEIRSLWASGSYTQQALADRYKVKQPAIGRIVNRVTYKWL